MTEAQRLCNLFNAISNTPADADEAFRPDGGTVEDGGHTWYSVRDGVSGFSFGGWLRADDTDGVYFTEMLLSEMVD